MQVNPRTGSAQFPRLWFGDEAPIAAPAPGSGIPSQPLGRLRQSFEQLTGWTLEFSQTPRQRRGGSSGLQSPAPAAQHLVIDDLASCVGPGRRAIDRPASQRLADDISAVWNELQTVRAELASREVELATCVATSLPVDETAKLEHLLQSLLRSAMALGGFDSASVWLVNDEALALNQRLAAGPHFPASPASRHLGESRADVRAMTGSVIVMESPRDAAKWQAPVECQSAVCVPVSSLSNLYGSLWLVRNQPGDVSEQVTTVLEIIAGRIAAELERAALARQLLDSRTPDKDRGPHARHHNRIEELLQAGEAEVQPPFAGWTVERRPVAPDPANGVRWSGFRVSAAESMLFLALHAGSERGWQKVSVARAAFESFATLSVSPATVVDGLNRVLQQRFDATDDVSICCIEIDPLTGEFRWTSTGSEWGRMADGNSGKKLLPRTGGAAVLPRRSSLTLSVPDHHQIWQPTLIIRRHDAESVRSR
jgi:phosphoserine phosphatase RsbU/P